MKHLLIKTVENEHVHLDAERNEYTVCGLDTMGDRSLGISEPIITKKKIDCPMCIQVIELCKKVRRTEWT